jgi:DNA replication protein DnaC
VNLAICREFARQVNERDCGFLEICGFTGNGKTRLACNIIREMNHSDSLYLRQGQLTSALRATYGRKDVFLHGRPQGVDEDESPPLLEVVQQVHLLMLDELGCNAFANDERLLLDELLKHRYEHRKPTILASNLPLDHLKEFLGDALSDRIADATGNGRFILQFSGESYRRTTGEDYLTGLP